MIAERSAIVARGMGVRRGGRWLLRPVAFGITEGVVGLAGPPGVGKTTLLATFATLRRPHAGALEILGHDVGTAAGLRAARARIGYLPGRFSWAENMTAGELVAYAAYYKRTRTSTVRAMLGRFDLADAAGIELALLPPDARLRAGLAAACVHEPDLVLLDDPLWELCGTSGAEGGATGKGPGGGRFGLGRLGRGRAAGTGDGQGGRPSGRPAGGRSSGQGGGQDGGLRGADGRATMDAAAMAELIPMIRSLAPTVLVTADGTGTLTGWSDRLLTLARGKLTELPATLPRIRTRRLPAGSGAGV